MKHTEEIPVPVLGVDEVEVVEILVAPGDEVTEEQGLIAIESEKASMDIPSPKKGVVKEILVKPGDTLKEGAPIMLLECDGEEAKEVKQSAEEADKPAAPKAPEPSPKAARAVSRPPAPAVMRLSSSRGKRVYTSPSVRRTAREFGVDLSMVAGSGRKGRILLEDVKAYVAFQLSKLQQPGGGVTGSVFTELPPWPKTDFSSFGKTEEVELTKIQKISGKALHRNWVSIPHVTQFEEANFTELEAYRKQQNQERADKGKGKLTPLAFIIKAVAHVLSDYPNFNSSLSEDGETLILKKYINIGFAADTPKGLVVPVIRDIPEKTIDTVAEEIIKLSKSARAGTLTIKDFQGSCFSISSLGSLGGTQFTPIINAPEVAILGISRAYQKPVWNGKTFEPRLTLPLALSYDHRVIDGVYAVRFAAALADYLKEMPGKLG